MKSKYLVALMLMMTWSVSFGAESETFSLEVNQYGDVRIIDEVERSLVWEDVSVNVTVEAFGTGRAIEAYQNPGEPIITKSRKEYGGMSGWFTQEVTIIVEEAVVYDAEQGIIDIVHDESALSLLGGTGEEDNPFLYFWIISICGVVISNILMLFFFKGKLSHSTAVFTFAFAAVVAFVAVFAFAAAAFAFVAAVVAVFGAVGAESKKAYFYWSVAYYLSMLVAFVLMYV